MAVVNQQEVPVQPAEKGQSGTVAQTAPAPPDDLLGGAAHTLLLVGLLVGAVLLRRRAER